MLKVITGHHACADELLECDDLHGGTRFGKLVYAGWIWHRFIGVLPCVRLYEIFFEIADLLPMKAVRNVRAGGLVF